MRDPRQFELPLGLYSEEPSWAEQDAATQLRLSRSSVANYCWDVVHGLKTTNYPHAPKKHLLEDYLEYLQDSEEFFKEQFTAIILELLAKPSK